MSTLKTDDNFNGYAYFDYEAYKRKDNTPCFLAENSDEVESWQDLFKETLETVKTKEFLLSVAENYDNEIALKRIEETDEKDIEFNFEYLAITGETVREFAESFMDNYFLGGDEVWCSISTKLQDYMM